MKLRRELGGWLLASPYLLSAAIFFLIPLVWSLSLLFFRWNLITPEREFVGLANFGEALTSPRVWNAMLVTYKFMGIIIPSVMVASIGLALIIHHIPRLKELFAVGFFLPYLASGVAIGLVIQGILSYGSPVNEFLRNVFGTSPRWLRDPFWAVLVISGMIVWKLSGYYALIFVAGLQAIPRELYEAAALDGAGAFTQFRRITLPLLYPAFYTVLVLAVGITLGIFTEPYVLTGGGPALATHTWQLEIYYQAFERFRAGYGATVALINAVVTFVTILIIRRLAESWGARRGFK
ncbi:MAG TPA: sugar ABC transporter permease [Candidatus Acetothermia bacterium]|nr:sugar ABC transporter permease [Candidatus Acetothermia bacterium]